MYRPASETEYSFFFAFCFIGFTDKAYLSLSAKG